MTNASSAKRINVLIDGRLHRKAKVKATEADLKWDAVVSEALQAWLETGSPNESAPSVAETNIKTNDATVDKRAKVLLKELLGPDEFLWLRRYCHGRKSSWNAVLAGAVRHWLTTKRPGRRTKA